MSKIKKSGLIVVSLLAIILLGVFFLFAVSQEKPKAQSETVQISEKQGHEEGSAACQEKHAKGECEDHEPGKPHEEDCDKNGQGHKEGSQDCLEKHAKGECKGHEPGKPHEMEKK